MGDMRAFCVNWPPVFARFGPFFRIPEHFFCVPGTVFVVPNAAPPPSLPVCTALGSRSGSQANGL
jgi:hypothetical protein